MPDEPTILTTQRLTLRPPSADDAVRIAELIGDFDVCGRLSVVPYPYTIDDAHEWLAKPQPRMGGHTLAWALDDGTGLIGHVGFRPDEDARPVIGYWLGKPYWRQGLMTEATRAAIQTVFSVTDAPVIRSGVFADNTASLALQRQLGFAEIGRSTMFNRARGEDLPHIDTELTRTKWEAGG